MAADADALAVFDALFERATRDRDANAAAALFADDEDVTMWGSNEPEQAVGPDALRELLSGVTASPTELAFRWDKRRVHVEGETAWVAASGEATATRPGGATLAIPYRVVAVLVRRDGAWRLHTYCGCEPQRPAG